MASEDDLTPDDVEEATPEDIQVEADEALTYWNQNADPEVRELVIGNYVMTGDIDPAVAGVDADTLATVEAAFTHHIQANVLDLFGLDMETWADCIDPAEYPAFRRDIVQGNWDVLRDHAQRVRQALDALPPE